MKTSAKTVLIIIYIFVIKLTSLHAQTNVWPATGNIGIGTLSPDRLLTLVGEYPRIFIRPQGGAFGQTSGIEFGGTFGSAANGDIGVRRLAQIQVGSKAGGAWDTAYLSILGVSPDTGVSPTEVIHINTDHGAQGVLGIGTSSPITKLQIGDPYLTVAQAWSSNHTRGLLIGEDSDNVYFGLQDDGPDAKHGTIIFGDDDNDFFTIQRNNTQAICSELVRILANGNVGIGTKNPYGKLDIRGKITLGAPNIEFSGNNYDNAIQFYSKGANTSWPTALHTGGRIYSTNVNADIEGYGKSGGWEGQALVMEAGYYWDDHGTEQGFRKWQLVILGNGNVGINMARPTHTLTVNGSIRSKEIIVDNANWPDYIFEESYQLNSLENIEKQIKQNKHLPGIPSAKEVASQGVNVGDMQALLLSKIEELTLHQIALNKRLSEQNEKINEQNQKIENQATRLSQLENENQQLKTLH